MSKAPNPRYAVFGYRDFRFLLAGRLSSAFGGQMLTFAVTWDLWMRTRSPFSLGLVGLAEVLPILLFALPAGVLADRKNRRTILLIAQTGAVLAAATLTALSILQGPIWAIYAALALLGLARAFSDPAASAYLPLVVPPEQFTQAATWSSSTFQIAVITGPTLAGLMIGLFGGSVTEVYGLGFVFLATQVVLVSLIRARPVVRNVQTHPWHSLIEGLRFLWGNKVLLSAITLDLFAVLLGGAVALLPIYATDILNVGPWGLGLLRSAPSVGALLMALFLAHRGPFRNAGTSLLWCVAGFGAATVVFGFSTWFPLSLAMLFVLGVLDNVSVVIRQTLMLTQVPDEMRGRTSAVNTVFISSSNELGDFESGVVAGFLGPVAAVVAGGLGTLLVVLGVWKFFPQLVALKELGKPERKSG
ncbi:MAG: MFS transporter [Spirochaetales bacterium]